jgi:hypothetical protein
MAKTPINEITEDIDTAAAADTDTDVTPYKSALEQYDETNAGTEDLPTSTRLSIVRILHQASKYRDGASQIEVEEFSGVILGLFEQRVLWPAEIDPSGKGEPLCRSYEGKVGYPESADKFPLMAAGDPTITAFNSAISGSTIQLSCNDCKLRKPGSHPKRANSSWCTQQFYVAAEIDLLGSGNSYIGLIPFQRSGISPLNSYMAALEISGNRPFSVRTTFSLEVQRYAGTQYSVPVLTKGKETNSEDHEYYAQTFLNVRNAQRERRDERTDVNLTANTIGDGEEPF